jgi:hypothetical protein
LIVKIFWAGLPGKEKPPLEASEGFCKEVKDNFSEYSLPLCERAAFGLQQGFQIDEAPAHFANILPKPPTLSRAGGADLQAGFLLGFGNVLIWVQ